MHTNEEANIKLLDDIDAQFISVMGPMGRMIIGDARKLWQQKQWKGPAGMRRYVKALSVNVHSLSDRSQFVKRTDKILINATRP